MFFVCLFVCCIYIYLYNIYNNIFFWKQRNIIYRNENYINNTILVTHSLVSQHEIWWYIIIYIFIGYVTRANCHIHTQSMSMYRIWYTTSVFYCISSTLYTYRYNTRTHIMLYALVYIHTTQLYYDTRMYLCMYVLQFSNIIRWTIFYMKKHSMPIFIIT